MNGNHIIKLILNRLGSALPLTLSRGGIASILQEAGVWLIFGKAAAAAGGAALGFMTKCGNSG
jgi:hypothetical protein